MVSPPRVPGKLRGTSPTCTRIIYTFIQEGPRDHVTECWVDGTQNLAAVHTQKSGQALPGPGVDAVHAAGATTYPHRTSPRAGRISNATTRNPPDSACVIAVFIQTPGHSIRASPSQQLQCDNPQGHGLFPVDFATPCSSWKAGSGPTHSPTIVVSQEFSTLAPSYLFTPTARRRCGRKLSAEDYYVLRYW